MQLCTHEKKTQTHENVLCGCFNQWWVVEVRRRLCPNLLFLACWGLVYETAGHWDVSGIRVNNDIMLFLLVIRNLMMSHSSTLPMAMGQTTTLPKWALWALWAMWVLWVLWVLCLISVYRCVLLLLQVLLNTQDSKPYCVMTNLPILRPLPIMHYNHAQRNTSGTRRPAVLPLLQMLKLMLLEWIGWKLDCFALNQLACSMISTMTN